MVEEVKIVEVVEKVEQNDTMIEKTISTVYDNGRR